MFEFYCVVSNSLYCRVCLFILWGSNFVDFVSFLSMTIYEVLHTWCLRYNIYSAWFLDIRISTYFWRSEFRLLFNQEAKYHYQNCLCDKDILLKTAQLFFKSSYELHVTLWSFFLEVRFYTAFQLRSQRNAYWHPPPELPLWQRYYAKNHSAFL